MHLTHCERIQNNNNNIAEIKIKEIDVQNKKRKLGNIKYGSV